MKSLTSPFNKHFFMKQRNHGSVVSIAKEDATKMRRVESCMSVASTRATSMVGAMSKMSLISSSDSDAELFEPSPTSFCQMAPVSEEDSALPGTSTILPKDNDTQSCFSEKIEDMCDTQSCFSEKFLKETDSRKVEDNCDTQSCFSEKFLNESEDAKATNEFTMQIESCSQEIPVQSVLMDSPLTLDVIVDKKSDISSHEMRMGLAIARVKEQCAAGAQVGCSDDTGTKTESPIKRSPSIRSNLSDFAASPQAQKSAKASELVDADMNVFSVKSVLESVESCVIIEAATGRLVGSTRVEDGKRILSADGSSDFVTEAIEEACKTLDTHVLSGCICYCTVQPRVSGLCALLWARVSELHVACGREELGALAADRGLAQYREFVSREDNGGSSCEKTLMVEECAEVFRRWQRMAGIIY